MILISVVAFAVHTLVVIRAIQFFATSPACRDVDKALVAGIGALSFLYLASQVYIAFTDPNILMTTRVSLRVGFDAAMAFVLWAVIADKAEVRVARERRR